MATNTASSITAKAKAGPRERLLETASRLFYAEGINSVGIDRILAESGVAKGSLYSTYGSKDGLIQAYLDSRRDRQARRITDAIAKVDDPKQKVLAVFDAQGQLFASRGFRGCAFVAASAEAPRGGTVDVATTAYRDWQRETFRALAEELGVEDPAMLARQLHLLYDGATLSMRLDRDPSVAADARAAAAALIGA
ncbi:MAG TPA: TetR/AcrR family transcriptional regulator [Marmoricola sp.]|jgi:AcrR family transcriptional regulator|nr:TetR/AcrR family transcriptional regulator [Marmoricola sp.]